MTTHIHTQTHTLLQMCTNACTSVVLTNSVGHTNTASLSRSHSSPSSLFVCFRENIIIICNFLFANNTFQSISHPPEGCCLLCKWISHTQTHKPGWMCEPLVKTCMTHSRTMVATVTIKTNHKQSGLSIICDPLLALRKCSSP